MKKILLSVLLLSAFCVQAQTPLIISSWIRNTTGTTASYWENTNGSPTSPSWLYHTTTDSADVQQVCYSTDTVYVRATGMTYNMGKFLNPGQCSTQTFVYRFPRNTSVPSTKVTAPASFAVGALLNGIPIYGRGAGTSWGGSSNVNGGPQIWNTEVYKSEGFVLDTAFGAHPQQQGQYHTHAKPYRMYESTAITTHSPIVGYSFDGYPIYGPYGYSSAMNSASSVTRMKSGYSLRNITQRHILPDGTVLTTPNYGPNVNTQYPLGTYCEDYEWLAANGGDLDAYNGRFCVTPEFPSGTYAYFVTLDATLTPQYPYYIGPQYYGSPITGNHNGGCLLATIPSTGVACVSGATGIFGLEPTKKSVLYPNPASSSFTVDLNANFFEGKQTVKMYNNLGELVLEQELLSESTSIQLPSSMAKGIYVVRLFSGSDPVDTQRMIIE
jgi:hypothetical protein